MAAQKATVNTVTNLSRNPRRIVGVDFAPAGQKGDTVELTDQNMRDERLMAKINHMVTLGVLRRGPAE